MEDGEDERVSRRYILMIRPDSASGQAANAEGWTFKHLQDALASNQRLRSQTDVLNSRDPIHAPTVASLASQFRVTGVPALLDTKDGAALQGFSSVYAFLVQTAPSNGNSAAQASRAGRSGVGAGAARSSTTRTAARLVPTHQAFSSDEEQDAEAAAAASGSMRMRRSRDDE